MASESVETRVVVEVHRASGLTAKRGELDGFAGAMTRLRGAYDAMHKTWPVSSPPDSLIDAMQAGDRLGYHPERARAEIKHFHDVLPKAQVAVTSIQKDFSQRMDEFAKRLSSDNWRVADLQAQKQHRLDALAQAGKLVNEAGK